MFDLNVDPYFVDDDGEASNGPTTELEKLDALMLCSDDGRAFIGHTSTPHFVLDLNVIPLPENSDGIQLDEMVMEANCEGEMVRGSNGNGNAVLDSDNGKEMQLPNIDSQMDEDLQMDDHVDIHDTEIEDVNIDQFVIEERIRKRNFLTNEQRESICLILKHSTEEGKLKPGIRKKLVSMFNTSYRVIDRIWRQLKDTGDSSHKKTKNCGRKRIELDLQQIRQVPLSQRTTLRSLACALNTNKSSLIRRQREGAIRRHSNAIKPLMKDDNMIARMKFCLSMLHESTIPHDPTFKSMHNIVHVDEKWFYMTKKSVNYYLLPDEEEPHRTCKSKNFITKVMFLVAVARPRFDSEGKETFSGKIGVFPLVTQEPAKRSSANRLASTLVTKPITSVTKEISRFFLIQKVLPAIKEKWPREHLGETIFIQQDNAPCHININDDEFCRVAHEGGFDIRLICQPANSPDLNVLDLGFFNAIQSLQHKEAPKTIDDLIGAVVKAFENFSSNDSNKIFLTLQSCMTEIMEHKGSINYKIPHKKKQMMEREGSLPAQMKCPSAVVQGALDYLREVDAL